MYFIYLAGVSFLSGVFEMWKAALTILFLLLFFFSWRISPWLCTWGTTGRMSVSHFPAPPTTAWPLMAGWWRRSGFQMSFLCTPKGPSFMTQPRTTSCCECSLMVTSSTAWGKGPTPWVFTVHFALVWLWWPPGLLLPTLLLLQLMQSSVAIGPCTRCFTGSWEKPCCGQWQGNLPEGSISLSLCGQRRA